MNPIDNRVFLDLKGLFTRAYHAGMSKEPLYNAEGKPVNTATYGLQTFLSKYYDPILESVNAPINMIGVMDMGNTYRKAIYPAYKANRDVKVPDPVETAQLEILKNLVRDFLLAQGVTLVGCPGQEADDVIAFLTFKLKGNKIIHTVDGDLVALGDHAKVFTTDGWARDYKGVPPSCVTLFKSITGDTSDNYPGVLGVGPAGFQKLVDEFDYDGIEELSEILRTGNRKQLDVVLQHTNNKVLHKCAEQWDHWRLMYKVAALNPGLCEGANVKLQWVKRAPTIQRLERVLDQANCPDLIAKYAQHCFEPILVTSANLTTSLAEMGRLADESQFVAWDYETFDPVQNPNYKLASKDSNFLSVLDSEITGCSFALGANANKVFYISVNHKDTANVDKSVVLRIIQGLEKRGIDMVAQNISFEATVTKTNFDHMVESWEDTKLYFHHIDEDTENGLKFMSKKYLNYDQMSYSKTLESVGAANMSEISGKDVLSYGADDSLVTGHLYALARILVQCEGSQDFISESECPAVAPLVKATIRGVKLDLNRLSELKAQDEVIMETRMNKIREILEKHCKEMNLEAVERLYADQKEYVACKAHAAAKEKPGSNRQILDAAVKDAQHKYKIKLKQSSFYVPPSTTVQYSPFLPTPAQITKVAGYLELPPLEKVTKMAISDYVSDNVHEFTKLLAKSAHELSKREGDNYKALEDYANKWLEMHGNVVHTGTQLNFGSPQQNQHLFYLLLGLPIRCRTMVQKGSIRHKNGLLGSPATDESAIQFALANDCADEPWKAEFLKALLEYKSAATRTALYWLPYPLWVDENSMIHPGFNSCGTVTRRPTGSKPNLMQVSKSVVRSIVIPSTPDNVIVSIDFSSQELRVLAGMTMDKTLLKAYQGAKPLDLHVLTACGLAPMFLPRFKNEIMSSANPGISFQPQVADNYGSMEASQALVGEFCAKGETFSADYTHIVYESASRIDYDWYKLHYNDDTGIGHFLSTVRGYAKTANFGVAYSAGPATVSMQLMIPLDDSKIIVDSMNTTYPGIPAWKNVVYDQAAKDGYVQTGFGSRRHCGTGLTKGKRWETSRWERQVANYLIQGTCADLLKVVLSKVYKLGVLEKYGAYLIAPIYDELLMECPKNPEILHPFLNEMCDVMEQPIPGICIPMVADCSFGKNWYEQKEVGNRPSLEKVINAVAEIDKSEPVGAIDLTQFIEIEEVEDEEMEYVGE